MKTWRNFGWTLVGVRCAHALARAQKGSTRAVTELAWLIHTLDLLRSAVRSRIDMSFIFSRSPPRCRLGARSLIPPLDTIGITLVIAGLVRAPAQTGSQAMLRSRSHTSFQPTDSPATNPPLDPKCFLVSPTSAPDAPIEKKLRVIQFLIYATRSESRSRWTYSHTWPRS